MKKEVLHPKQSTLSVQVRMNMLSVERMLNEQVGTVLFQDAIEQMQDLHVQVERTGNIHIRLSGLQVHYQVPLKVTIRKSTFLAEIIGAGAIQLDFTTDMDIRSDWEVRTHTRLNNYQWSEKPNLQVGIANMPIQKLVDTVLESNRSRIEQAIDTKIQKELQLQKHIKRAWQQLGAPFLVSEPYNTWLWVQPQQFCLEKPTTNATILHTNLLSTGIIRLFVGNPATDAVQANLPLIKIQTTTPSQTQLSLGIRISMPELNRQLKTHIVEQQFSYAGQDITVKGIGVQVIHQKMMLRSEISGSINGTVLLEGVPVYDALQYQLRVEDIDVEIQTKNIFHKSAVWLLRKELVKWLEKNAVFSLEQQVENLRQQLQNYLNEIKVGDFATIQGTIQALTLQDAQLTQNGIEMLVTGKGQLALTIS